MRYPEKLYEAMDASMFCQSDRLVIEVAASGISIFLRADWVAESSVGVVVTRQ